MPATGQSIGAVEIGHGLMAGDHPLGKGFYHHRFLPGIAGALDRQQNHGHRAICFQTIVIKPQGIGDQARGIVGGLVHWFAVHHRGRVRLRVGAQSYGDFSQSGANVTIFVGIAARHYGHFVHRAEQARGA
jgi:hypothetical protein